MSNQTQSPAFPQIVWLEGRAINTVCEDGSVPVMATLCPNETDVRYLLAEPMQDELDASEHSRRALRLALIMLLRKIDKYGAPDEVKEYAEKSKVVLQNNTSATDYLR